MANSKDFLKVFKHKFNLSKFKFVGTMFILKSSYDHSVDDEIKEKLDNHTIKQTSLGKYLRNITATDIHISKLEGKVKKSTLAHNSYQ